MTRIVSTGAPVRSRRRFTLLAVSSLCALSLSVVAAAGGDVSTARAEACATTGLQPRVLVTDDVGMIETQFCLGGEWTTTSITQVAVPKVVIKETAFDPADDLLELPKAEAFFGIDPLDPYENLSSAKKLLDRTTSPGDILELREALADIRTQALKNRQATSRADGCRTRPRAHSDAAVRTNFGWDPPESNGFPAAPSQITFEISDKISTKLKVAILNAIEQYPAAVAAQDVTGRYPSTIVPRDPADSRPATITFEPLVGWNGHLGETSRDPFPVAPVGARTIWVSGVVKLFDTASPAVVGHEIGHVLGLSHLPVPHHGVMVPRFEFSYWQPWNPHLGTNTPAGVAFDQCMLGTPMEPTL